MTDRIMPISAATATGCEPEPRPLAQLTRDMVRMRDKAWNEFHQRFFSRLFHYALTLHSGDRASAQDSVQSAYLRAVRHIRRFDDEAVMWSWLTLLVRCAAADQGRKVAAHSRLQERLIAETEFQRTAALAAKSSDARYVLLEEALTRLPLDDRYLLEEKYSHGQPTARLAASRKTSEKAIECRLRRLRMNLKSQIHALTKNTRL